MDGTVYVAVYSSEGYLEDSGTVMPDGIQEGDKSKDDSLMLYGLISGETYTLSFSF